MTYTINWNHTQFTIPTKNSSGIIINRWPNNSDNSIVTWSITNCGEPFYLDEMEEFVYKCEFDYITSGYHTITINNKNEPVKKISLNSWNVTDIEDFIDFEQLSEIYLRYNKLSTIPLNIWKYRNQIKTIKLSDSISYNNEDGTKYIDLRNNPIEFIWLTKIGNYNLAQYESDLYPNFQNATEYNFEWFGFSANSNITYDYNINDFQGNSTQIYNYTWIANTWISINTQLNSWTYYT